MKKKGSIITSTARGGTMLKEKEGEKESTGTKKEKNGKKRQFEKNTPITGIYAHHSHSNQAGGKSVSEHRGLKRRKEGTRERTRGDDLYQPMCREGENAPSTLHDPVV